MWFILLLFSVGVYAEADERPIIEISNGAIRGVYRLSSNGRKFAAFEGVPYAEPPIGQLRFQRSVAKKAWTGIWDATNVYQCMQINHEPRDLGLVEGSEDCLYLNVYTPRPGGLPTAANQIIGLDVIVHFHSGAFMWGRGDLYGPNHLMDHDVVFVNLNYRLGPLGFLSMEDPILPGNNGLKDQVLALQWIRENIPHFGGNRDSITITGLSAGGASTHYHFLSPLSRGLFHRGISVSGNALCNWALAENHAIKARRLGRIVGCEQDDTNEFVTCLRQRSATQITAAIKQFQPWLYNPYTPFGPRVGDEFLPDYPYNLLRNGHVADLPWITSVTSEEGLYPAAQFLFNDTWLPYLNEHWLKIAPYIFHYDDTVDETQQAIVSHKIREYYLKNQSITRDTYHQLVQAIGDRLFVVDSEKAARLQANANKSPVYYYRFSYRGDHSYSEYFAGSDVNVGVCHADDLMYIASADKSWFTKYMQSKQDKKMSEILINIWLTYIKTGQPIVSDAVQWKRVSSNLSSPLNYLHIASPLEITIETASTLGHTPFWDSLSFQENHQLPIVKDEL